MTTRTYAILDVGRAGTALELQQGGLIVTHDAAVSGARQVLSNQEKTSGQHFVEVVFYGEGDLLDYASFGVVAVQNLGQYVGENAASVGWLPGAGSIRVGGVEVATFDEIPKRTPLGVFLDIDAGSVSFYANGVPVATIALPTGTAWRFAVGVGGYEAFDLYAYCNFGQRQFEQPVVSGGQNGWSVERPGLGDLYLSNEPFTTGDADPVPNFRYSPRILDARSIQIRRSASVWPWGESNAAASFSEIVLDNTDGALDYLTFTDARDATVTLRIIEVDDDEVPDLSNAYTVAVANVDSINVSGDRTVSIRLRDKISQFQKPLQRRLFLPFLNDAIANRPWPLSFGAVRNMEPVFYEYITQTSPPLDYYHYVVHDSSAFTAVLRDNGDPFNAGTFDYALLDNGVRVENPIYGKITADVSVVGAIEIPPGSTDVLNGRGYFTSVGSPPTIFEFPQTQDVGDATISTFNGELTVSLSDDYAIWRYTPTGSPGDAKPCKTGRRYAYRFTVDYVNPLLKRSAIAPAADKGVGLQFYNPDGGVPPEAVISAGVIVDTPGQYSGAFTCLFDCYVYIFAVGALDSFGVAVKIRDLEVFDLGPDMQEGDLGAITLTQYVREVMGRGQFTEAEDYSLTDVELIDAATNYVFGTHFPSGTTVDEALRRPLDSFTATRFIDREGKLRVRRLEAPPEGSPSAPVYEIDGNNMLSPLQPELDSAPGLTTQIGARRNWSPFTDNEFVADVLEVDFNTRAAFKRQHQVIRSSVFVPTATYAHTQLAQPLDSMLDDPEDAQTEIDRIVSMYADRPRAFYRVRIGYDGLPPDLNFGDVVKVTYPRHGFAAGRNLIVRDITLYPFARRMELRLWG